MINTDMRTYNYFLYGAPNGYGEQTLIKDEKGAPAVQGSIKMAINTTSQAIQDNINYQDCSYIGLTLNKTVNESFVIKYGEEKLKVLYVNPKGKFIQVYLKKI